MSTIVHNYYYGKDAIPPPPVAQAPHPVAQPPPPVAQPQPPVAQPPPKSTRYDKPSMHK